MREREKQEWTKRINSVIPRLCGDEQAHANFLLITVRNEVLNSLKMRSLETVFTDLNTIDLSSIPCKVVKERINLLELYDPRGSKYSLTEKEKEEIADCAPNLGFPQCCRLYRDIPDLQKERVRFFQKPFYFLNEALSQLQECPALLFLFLNNGMISVKDLDPNSEKIDKILLEEAFEINLVDGDDDRTSLTYKKKIEIVKQSLDRILGFLVTKEHERDDEVYRFYHDSIYVAVALLYGKITPIGYIHNSPSEFLSYLTISKTSSNMIVISSDHYTDMCKRLLREFVSETNDYGTSIGSLDIWQDHVFVQRFFRVLDDRKDDKCTVLNRACAYGAEECALYLLSHGVKPDDHTPWCVVLGGSVNVLKIFVKHGQIFYEQYDEMKDFMLFFTSLFGLKECALYLLSVGVKPKEYWFGAMSGGCMNVFKTIVKDLNDDMKLAVLNEACDSGSKECALYLLYNGVKPAKVTPFWLLIARHRGTFLWIFHTKDRYEGDVDLLRKVVIYLNDEMKLALLNKACSYGSAQCAIYLLSEGVKPDKDTPWWSLITGGIRYGKGNVDVLRKVVIYLNDKIKLSLLNEACDSGSEESAIYLLSECVKPDKDTPWWSLIRGGRYGGGKGDVDVLRKVVIYLNDEMKLAALNKACASGSEECALYLLCEGVKPVKDTPLWSLITGGEDGDGKGDVDVLSKVVIYLNDDMKLALLNEACSFGSEQCDIYLQSYLLCERVNLIKKSPFVW